MDFLKNILVSVPGYGAMPVHTGCPEWPSQGRSQTITPAVTWQGALGGVWRPPVTRGRRDPGQRGLGVRRGCGAESGTRAFPPWPGGVRRGPGVRLGRAHICAPLSRIPDAGEGLRGPSPTCRLCQVGCQGGRGRDTVAALLPPGCRHSELAGRLCGCSPPCPVLCLGRPWRGTVCCHRALGLLG